MKKVILTFCSLALLSVSCKKDDTPTLTPSNKLYKCLICQV